MVTIKSWKKDKGKHGIVEIISKESGEVVGELKFNFNNKKERD